MLLEPVVVLVVPLGGYNLAEAEQAVAEMKSKPQSHHHHTHHPDHPINFFWMITIGRTNY